MDKKKSIVVIKESETDVSKRFWGEFPRNTKFYQPILLTFGKLSVHCIENVIHLLLEWIPDHSRDYSTISENFYSPFFGNIEEFTFNTFIKKIEGISSDNIESRFLDIIVRFFPFPLIIILFIHVFHFLGSGFNIRIVYSMINLCISF